MTISPYNIQQNWQIHRNLAKIITKISNLINIFHIQQKLSGGFHNSKICVLWQISHITVYHRDLYTHLSSHSHGISMGPIFTAKPEHGARFLRAGVASL